MKTAQALQVRRTSYVYLISAIAVGYVSLWDEPCTRVSNDSWDEGITCFQNSIIFVSPTNHKVGFFMFKTKWVLDSKYHGMSNTCHRISVLTRKGYTQTDKLYEREWDYLNVTHRWRIWTSSLVISKNLDYTSLKRRIFTE